MSTSQFPIGIQASVTGSADAERLSGALGKIADSLDRASTKAESSKTSFESFGSSVRQAVENPLQAAGSALESFLVKLGPVGVGVVAGGAALGVMAVKAFELSKQIADLAHNSTILATELGISTQNAQLWQRMAEMEGAGAERLVAGIRKLSQVMEDTSPQAEKTRSELAKLGVTVRDVHTGAIMPLDQLLPDILKHLAGMEEGTKRNNLAIDTLGRGGLILLPLGKHFDELGEKVSRSGAIMDAQAIKKAQEYHEQLELLGLAWDALKLKVGVPIVGLINYILRNESQPGAPALGQDKIPIYRDGQIVGYGEGHAPRGPELPDYRVFGGTDRAFSVVGHGMEIPDALKIYYAPLIAKNDETVKAILAGAQDSVEGAKKKLAELYSQLRLGVLPEVNAPIERQIAQQKAIVSDFENAVKFNAVEWEKQQTKRSGASVPTLFTDQWQKEALATQKKLPYFGGGGLVIPEAAIATANQGIQERDAAFGRGLIEAAQTREHLAAEELDHRTRMIELLAGPGGEIAAATQVYNLRMAAAKTEEDRQRARIEVEEKLLELYNRNREAFVSSVQSAFDSITSGKGLAGIQDMFSSLFKGFERQVVGNLAREAYSIIGGDPAKGTTGILPHAAQGGTLAKLLAGTPFGANPLDRAGITLNTAGIKLDLAATKLLSLSATGGGGGAVAAVGKMFGGGTPVSAAYLDSIGINPSTGEFYPGSSGGGGGGGETGTNLPFGSAALGMLGIGVGGAFGVRAGIKQGGAKGAMTAAGSGLTAAGGALMLTGIGTPVGAILAGAGIALGLMTSIFGDPKQERAKAIDTWLTSRKYTEPLPVSIERSTSGQDVFYDFRGGLRTSPPSVTNIYQISTLDPQNFQEFLERNPDPVNRGVAKSIDRGGELVPKMAQALGLS